MCSLTLSGAHSHTSTLRVIQWLRSMGRVLIRPFRACMHTASTVSLRMWWTFFCVCRARSKRATQNPNTIQFGLVRCIVIVFLSSFWFKSEYYHSSKRVSCFIFLHHHCGNIWKSKIKAIKSKEKVDAEYHIRWEKCSIRSIAVLFEVNLFLCFSFWFVYLVFVRVKQKKEKKCRPQFNCASHRQI